MRYSIVAILISFLITLSCANKEKVGNDLPMPEEKIIDILIDMHYAGEASRITRNINHDSLMTVYRKQVFEIQKIDSTQHNELMNFLETNLETFYSIEQKVHLKIKELK
ncbi:MAG: hypothetical protein ACJA1A_002515 [Saprospiraceae bacterium]|jgi:hypothetical protein|tara:strand:- start:662 stop:988 length:327 start_codon:yes stop_codon:yes gene_type:complete